LKHVKDNLSEINY